MIRFFFSGNVDDMSDSDSISDQEAVSGEALFPISQGMW